MHISVTRVPTTKQAGFFLHFVSNAYTATVILLNIVFELPHCLELATDSDGYVMFRDGCGEILIEGIEEGCGRIGRMQLRWRYCV